MLVIVFHKSKGTQVENVESEKKKVKEHVLLLIDQLPEWFHDRVLYLNKTIFSKMIYQ